MKDLHIGGVTYPSYGAESVYTCVKMRGHILPATGFTDQFHVRFPDGTQLFVEPWDCQSPFRGDERDEEAIKEREMKRVEQGLHRNKPSSALEIDLAFRRNEGKFVEDQ